MKFILIINFVLALNYYSIYSQQNNYFQQKVDYHISAKLNDRDHFLTGSMSITYYNNSPDVLDRIGMHLWPNAYSIKNSEFARQKLLHRSSKFHDSRDMESGNIKLSGLKVANVNASLETIKDNPDMAWLILPQVLMPGEKLIIEADFILKIPNSFSRLGHIDQSYQITQWYMKPAVYDQKGWHLMPYLDQGEFYSEFGDFEVKITIPKNYYVAATGTLQEISEIDFINQRAVETQSIIEQYNSSKTKPEIKLESSDEWKTLTYKAENVHDFAWFADKSFFITKDKAKLSSGKLIETYAYFKDLKFWPSGASYVKRALEFYSKHIGEYPWPQATAVHSALSAGGGMEYPMITVINDVNSSKSLDRVIAHEVGHNWFYGILASNERDHPWMDEGINSYYEKRYMQQYYKKSLIVNKSIDELLNRTKANQETQLLYQIVSHYNLDQAPGLASEKFTILNYGYDVYIRTAELFKYLEDYLGTEQFDQLMKTYFDQWKFKHPYPEDLQKVFLNYGNKDTKWLFDDLINTNRKIDYSLQKIKKEDQFYRLIIKNNGQVNAPIQLSGIRKDSVIYKDWIEGFTGTKEIRIDDHGEDKLKIDNHGMYFDYNTHNNTLRTTGVLKRVEPLKLGISSIYNNPDRTDIMLYPSLLYNYINGYMLGLHIGRSILPTPQWNYQLSPKYAFKSKSLTGTAQFSYRENFINGFVNYLKLAINTKRFGLNKNRNSEKANHYIQINPNLTIDFRTNAPKLITSQFQYHWFYVNDEIDLFNDIDSNYSSSTLSNNIHKLSYSYHNPFYLGPYSIKVESYYEQYKSILSSRYLRIDTELKKSIRWRPKCYFDTRFFISFFPINSERNRSSIASRQDQRFIRGSVGAAYQSYHDYTNEDYFLDRSSQSDFWTHQIDIRQGGLKIAPGLAYRNNLGNSNSFLASMNLSTDLPIKYVGRILRPYFDLAYVEIDRNLVNGSKWMYSGGIQIRLIPEIFSIYFPIINSQNIEEIYESDQNKSYWNRVTFSLRFKYNNYKEIMNFIQ
ncbi:MAG: M1 family metallopeptidase [Saprospiraceae bacterium]|nr:M1 family metallopeptidase [Saprospiraceae bacterium]